MDPTSLTYIDLDYVGSKWTPTPLTYIDLDYVGSKWTPPSLTYIDLDYVGSKWPQQPWDPNRPNCVNGSF